MEIGAKERNRYSERYSDFQCQRVLLHQLGNMPANSRILFVWMFSEHQKLLLRN